MIQEKSKETYSVVTLGNYYRTALHVNDICKNSTGNLFLWTKSLAKQHSSGSLDDYFKKGVRPQHLYIAISEKIKPGDWYLMWFESCELMQCRDEEEAKRCNEHPSIMHNCKKIIASTNPSLNLPKILTSFIEQYVSNYNSRDIIRELYNIDNVIEGLKNTNEIKETCCWEDVIDDFIDDYPCMIPVELEKWLEKNYPNGLIIKNSHEA